MRRWVKRSWDGKTAACDLPCSLMCLDWDWGSDWFWSVPNGNRVEVVVKFRKDGKIVCAALVKVVVNGIIIELKFFAELVAVHCPWAEGGV